MRTAGKRHRACHRRRRPGRVVSRRGRRAPSGCAMDRHRGEESAIAACYVAEKIGADFVTAGLSRAAAASGSHLRHHRHRRAPPCGSDHGGGRARRADADRKAARDRSWRIRARARGHHTMPNSMRWSATLSASAADGSRRKEKVRTGALGDVTLVTSRAFMNRLVAIDNYKRTDDPQDDLAHGDIGHACARHRHVVSWKRRRRSKCYARSVDKVLGPTYAGHRRHRGHDHVLGRQRLSPQYLVGAAGDLAGRRLQPRSRHHRH